MNAGLTNLRVWALALDPTTPTTLYAGTYGGGVFVLRPTWIGLYRDGTCYLDLNGNESWNRCETDGCVTWGGVAGDTPHEPPTSAARFLQTGFRQDPVKSRMGAVHGRDDPIVGQVLL